MLLVEDNTNNRIVVTSYLNDRAIEIANAENGKEALSRMKERTYDVVLMDLEMPQMDGYEATQTFRDWENENRGGSINPSSRLPLTHSTELVRRPWMPVCDDYLAKPVEKDDLIEKLRPHLTVAGGRES